MDILIRPFAWSDWDAMWIVRRFQLAEAGIHLEGPIAPQDPTIVYNEANPAYHEIDMDRIDACYLSGRGNFWIAWADGQPVGYVGAQDKDDYIELRRMYVREAYRRLGIGFRLVHALIDHCQAQSVGRIKLWTDSGGPGRFLYATLGFRETPPLGDEVNHPSALDGEIRMCLDLMAG